MKLYAGIDLHSSNSYLAIVDGTGKRIFHRKLPNDATTIIETLSLYEGSVAGIVVESTYNWYEYKRGRVSKIHFPVEKKPYKYSFTLSHPL